MKTTKEKIEIMQAYIDGKQIQLKGGVYNDWTDWKLNSAPIWDWSAGDYRIKPEKEEPTYRPYESTDEMIADFCERFVENPPEHKMPLIWLKDSDPTISDDYWLVNSFCRVAVRVKHEMYGLKRLFENFTYLDGTPVGKLVE